MVRENGPFDIVVVGAEVHPKAKLLILDSGTHIGGVWSGARVFDGFWTQSGARMIGFSDVEFKIPTDSPVFWDTCPAKHVTQYLEDYMSSHVYHGQPLSERVRLQRKVISIERVGHVWHIVSESPSLNTERYTSSKIVIASGHTSTPILPKLPGLDMFPNKIVTHDAFGQFSAAEDGEYQKRDSKYEHVVVLGGGKSAADLAYDAAKLGKHVSWIIRRSNSEGPALFVPAPGRGRYRNSVEKGNTRLAQLFAPSSFAPKSNVFTYLLHNTRLGERYISKRITNVRNSCIALPNYEGRKDSLAGFKDLKPTSHLFWFTGPLGLAQHDDFWDVISTRVHVYRADITQMHSNGTISLSDGSKPVAADVVLCGTGWRSDYPFFKSYLETQLGLSHSRSKDDPRISKQWDELLENADRQVLSRFPLLSKPPAGFRKPTETHMTTTRLYNCMVPVDGPFGLDGDHSIAFLGHCEISNSFRAAEVQAIWCTAFFDGSLASLGRLPDVKTAQKRVAYMNAFSRRRYPSRGYKGDCLFFELLWYTDHLMEEVGICSHRSRRRYMSKWLDPCLASDFKYAADEYRQKFYARNPSI